jgi:hypothetical protein
MAIPKMRICADSELPTIEAIKFRIEQIKTQNPVLTPALARRISALKLRLPQNPNEAMKPAVRADLLISKADLGWSGFQPQMYNPVTAN